MFIDYVEHLLFVGEAIVQKLMEQERRAGARVLWPRARALMKSYLRFLFIIKSNCFPLPTVFMYNSEIVCDGKSFLLSYLSFINYFYPQRVLISIHEFFLIIHGCGLSVSLPFLLPFPISFLYKCECYCTSPSFINCWQVFKVKIIFFFPPFETLKRKEKRVLMKLESTGVEHQPPLISVRQEDWHLCLRQPAAGCCERGGGEDFF